MQLVVHGPLACAKAVNARPQKVTQSPPSVKQLHMTRRPRAELLLNRSCFSNVFFKTGRTVDTRHSPRTAMAYA